MLQQRSVSVVVGLTLKGHPEKATGDRRHAQELAGQGTPLAQRLDGLALCFLLCGMVRGGLRKITGFAIAALLLRS